MQLKQFELILWAIERLKKVCSNNSCDENLQGMHSAVRLRVVLREYSRICRNTIYIKTVLHFIVHKWVYWSVIFYIPRYINRLCCGQSSWPQIQMFLVRFSPLSGFVKKGVSTQHREHNWGVTWKKQLWLRPRKPRLTAARTRCDDLETPLYPLKSALASSAACSVRRYCSLADW